MIKSITAKENFKRAPEVKKAFVGRRILEQRILCKHCRKGWR